MQTALIIISLMVSVVSATPSYESQPPAQVINYQQDLSNIPNSYKFQYILISDGQNVTLHDVPVIASIKNDDRILTYKTDDCSNYDASDGSSRTEAGAILNPGTNDAALDVHGSVRWYNALGHLYEMTYKAGKRGYRTIIRKLS